jgi:hypothetical protein
MRCPYHQLSSTEGKHRGNRYITTVNLQLMRLNYHFTSLAQLLYGLIAILGPKDRNGDCRPEAARIAFGPNLAPGLYETDVSKGHPNTAISNASSG